MQVEDDLVMALIDQVKQLVTNLSDNPSILNSGVREGHKRHPSFFPQFQSA